MLYLNIETNKTNKIMENQITVSKINKGRDFGSYTVSIKSAGLYLVVNKNLMITDYNGATENDFEDVGLPIYKVLNFVSSQIN